MIDDVKKEHSNPIAKAYKLLRNLLSCNPQTQWDRICCKMHNRELWARVNSGKTVDRCLTLWIAFWDWLELHTLTVLTADTAKASATTYSRQCYCPREPLCISTYLAWDQHLPTLKDSLKAVVTTKKGNISFSKADLASIIIILASVLILWQNQYNSHGAWCHQT